MIEKIICKYCGWEFPSGLLQSITENSDSVFCENCGTELMNENFISDTIESEGMSEKDTKRKKKKRPLFSKVYEYIRNTKSPIARVLLDSDFTKLFKDSFIIVMSRVIYSHLRAFELESVIDIKTMELTKEVLDKLSKSISPVLTMRIKREYLGNLRIINTKDFEKWLKKLHTKLKLNKKYRQDFIIYLRWLINEVYIIVSDLWNAPNLPKFERVIRNDLRSFISNESTPNEKVVQEIYKNFIKLNPQKDSLYSFPSKTRNSIIIFIFRILSFDDDFTDNVLIDKILHSLDKIEEIPKEQLTELKIKLTNEKYEIFKIPILNYIKDLILIVKYLKELSECSKKDEEIITKRKIIIGLKERGLTLNYLDGTLKKFIQEIIVVLENAYNIKIDRVQMRDLSAGPNKKICGKCGKAKTFNQFINSKSRGRSWLCKKCFNKNASIRKNVLKLQIAKYIFLKNQSKKSNPDVQSDIIKCNKCKIDLLIPPNIEFHHTGDKMLSWDDVSDFTYDKAIKMLKKEKLIILCSNCHAEETAVKYRLYKDLILNMDLINQSAKNINDKLGVVIKNLPKNQQRQMKARLKKLLIKQFIIKNFYDYKCTTCGKTTNLPAFEFHHVDSTNKEKQWLQIYNLNVKKVMESIINENCVLICNNCHEMIHSRFKEFYPEVFIKVDKLLYKNNSMLHYLPKIKKYIESIHENLSKFKQFNLIDLNPELLKVDLRVRESNKTIFDTYQNFIYETINLNGYNEFTKKNIMDLSGTSRSSVKDQFFKLISSGLIEEVGTPKYVLRVGRTKVYKLTEDGTKIFREKFNDFLL